MKLLPEACMSIHKHPDDTLVRNPKTYTLNPEILNPKPLNPKPYTLDSKSFRTYLKAGFAPDPGAKAS